MKYLQYARPFIDAGFTATAGRAVRGHEGPCATVNVSYKGTKVLTMSDDSYGGPTNMFWTDKATPEIKTLFNDILSNLPSSEFHGMMLKPDEGYVLAGFSDYCDVMKKVSKMVVFRSKGDVYTMKGALDDAAREWVLIRYPDAAFLNDNMWA